MYSVTLNYYLPIRVSYRSRIRCSPIPSLFDCATTRLSGRWKIEIFTRAVYVTSQTGERDANNSDIPVVDYG